MSDNQKYYYLKLVDNFFDRDEMIMLESMPDGYMYSNILLKLYLRSLKNVGKLMFNDRIPYNPTMLASITRHPVAVVEKAVDMFEQLGLVEILDNGAIYMLDIQDFIGKSSTEADRKRSYRRRIDEEKKQLLEEKKGQMSVQKSRQTTGQMSDKTPPELELELEQELELDIELEQEIKQLGNSVSNKVVDNVNNVDNLELQGFDADAVFILNHYLPNLSTQDKKRVLSALKDTGNNFYYLEEKIKVLQQRENINSQAGFLVKAIKDDYKLRGAC